MIFVRISEEMCLEPCQSSMMELLAQKAPSQIIERGRNTYLNSPTPLICTKAVLSNTPQFKVGSHVVFFPC